jgi:hypothetical protein
MVINVQCVMHGGVRNGGTRGRDGDAFNLPLGFITGTGITAVSWSRVTRVRVRSGIFIPEGILQPVIVVLRVLNGFERVLYIYIYVPVYISEVIFLSTYFCNSFSVLFCVTPVTFL